MHEKTAGAHGPQAVQRRLHPIRPLQRREGGAVRLAADQRPHEVADGGLVGLAGEIGLQQPGGAVGGLEGGDRRLGRVEHLAEDVGHGPRRALVGREAHDMRRAVRVQAFEHAGAYHRIRRAVTAEPSRERGEAALPGSLPTKRV